MTAPDSDQHRLRSHLWIAHGMMGPELDQLKRSGNALTVYQEIHDEFHNHPLWSHVNMAAAYVHVHNTVPSIEVQTADSLEEWTW
jgi:hypothetical protein